MQVDYKAPIRGIFKIVLQLLTQLTAMFAQRIKDAEQRQMATAVLDSAGETIQVLSDADPNDKEQLREVLNKLLNRTDFQASAKEEMLGYINKLKNQEVRTALAIINTHAFPVAGLVTDDTSDNSEQIREYMAEVLQTQDGIAFFNALLRLVLPDNYANTLTLIIIQAIISWLEEDGTDEEKAATIRSLKAAVHNYQLAA